jgi:hypothetical protein
LGGLQFEASLGNKISETPISIYELGVVVHVCKSRYEGINNQENHSPRLALDKSEPYLKNN